AALQLASILADIEEGETVFCTDLTFIATVNPIGYEGAIPVFIDSEYKTWNMDPKALEKAFELYPNTRIVILVDLYGVPAQIDEIQEICTRHGATLIVDSAESLGATYKGKHCGTFGNYSIFSFNGNKIITGSSGGMFVTYDKEAADKVRKWATQARENVPWYQHTERGFNYRMSNVIAGVVRGQLLHLDEHIKRKFEIYERYKQGLKDYPVTMNPYDAENSHPNFWLSCLLIDKDAMCKQVRGETSVEYYSEPGKTCPTEILDKLAEYNIEGRPIWKPMHMQPIFKDRKLVTKDGIADDNTESVGNDLFDRGVCLPSDIKMTDEQQDMVIEIIKECFE
nr:DegT/DnrJ/EryC1/StrS family aminotransferase [Lachnospiraceae bacterium]